MMTGKKILLFFILIVWSTVPLWATHQRSGEITYEHLSGLTYRFTIITYTYTPSPADRPEIEVLWGDGSSSIIARVAKVNMENDISKNVYIGDHTYSGNGSYTISFEDPNRNAGIVNIPNSVATPFYIETTLIINPFLGNNNSPQLLNPPIDNGCTNVPYYHNPGAYDVDGDSLSYSLIDCRGYDGEVIPGYALPNASSSISIDPITGDFVWDSPTMVGEYNIAIQIQEWRAGVLISQMVRDMQISIAACDNNPPVIDAHDTCITAGTLLNMDITARDDEGSTLELSATGDCLSLPAPHATFTDMTGPAPLTSHLYWRTSCQHIRKQKYSVVIKAKDQGPHVELSSFKTIFITIVAPKPELYDAEAIGNTVKISWQHYECSNGVGFKIYRRNGSNDFEPSHCQVGMPADQGYTLIGTCSSINDTCYTDTGINYPLHHGNEYCYRIVAYFSDGAESYVSDEVCARLANDAPLITHVDVEETDQENGIINIVWCKPTEFDSTYFTGPGYQYRIFRKIHNSGDVFQPIDTTFSIDDTAIVDHNLNTFGLPYDYKIEFWGEANGTFQHIETSDISSSVFIDITPMDRSLLLQWNEEVPWTNEQYIIYRLGENLHTWDSIGTTNLQSYLDEGLENGETYCYYVCAIGAYYVPDTISPLLNKSERQCGIPVDLIPPEIPALTVTTDCESVLLEWEFSSAEAAADAKTFYIYYRQTLNEELHIIDSIDGEYCNGKHCRYELTNLPFITGCFALAATDSNNNLSNTTPETCFDVDDCMDYRLPNVFTPNDDGVNDIFGPYTPYHNVEKIDMVIYNRWGRKVFETEDPDIKWDGKDYLSKQPSSDGTYFYSCDVYLHSLNGTVVRPMHGTITLITSR